MLKIAIVGCGAITEMYYTNALHALHEEAVVDMYFDPDANRRAALAGAFTPAQGTDSFDRILKSGVDLAVVASPARFHAEHAIALLRAGISVLCEKPMASNVNEALTMIEAAKERNKVLAIGLFRRFFPATRSIFEIIQQQTLGRALKVSVFEGGAFNWPAQSASLFKKQSAQGGVLLDIGIHVFDLLQWWFGTPSELEYEDDAMGGIEVNCRAVMKFPGGVDGSMQLSREWGRPNLYEIEFERGWVRWAVGDADHLEFSFKGVTEKARGELFEVKKQTPVPAATYHQSFVLQLRNVIRSVRGEETPLVPGSEGIKSLRLIEVCYGRRKPMPMEWLSEAEQTRARELNAA